jgi:hypothetical protein
MTRIPALTLHRPWTSCFTDIPGPAAKRIENRSWVTGYRGPIYLHAGKAWDDGAVHLANRIWAGAGRHHMVGSVRVSLATDEPALSAESANHPTGVVAEADLTGICTASLTTAELECDCGPWAFPGQTHWQFGDVRKLGQPVPCRGAQQLWRLPAHVEVAVRAQLGAVAA